MEYPRFQIKMGRMLSPGGSFTPSLTRGRTPQLAGNTPLHIATILGTEAVLKALVDAGADVNARQFLDDAKDKVRGG